MKYLSKRKKSKAFISIVILWIVSSFWIIPINLWSMFVRKENNNNNDNTLFMNNQNLKFNNDSSYSSYNAIINDSKSSSIKCVTAFETNKSFKIITTLFNFYIPLIGMSLIYGKIFYTIKNRTESNGFSKILSEKHQNISIKEENIQKLNNISNNWIELHANDNETNNRKQKSSM